MQPLKSPKLVRIADSYLKRTAGAAAETATSTTRPTTTTTTTTRTEKGGTATMETMISSLKTTTTTTASSRLPPDGHEFPADYLDASDNRTGSSWKILGRDERSERSVKDKIALFTHDPPATTTSTLRQPARKYPIINTLSCSVDNLSRTSPMSSPVIRTSLAGRIGHGQLLSTIKSGSGCSSSASSTTSSLLDVNSRKTSSSMTQLSVVERRKSLSTKLRGLVIPDVVDGGSTDRPTVIDLPEIISKDSVLAVAAAGGGLGPLTSPLRSPVSPDVTDSAAQQQKRTSTALSSLPWKSNSPTLPKYSPAFKRKELTVLPAGRLSGSGSISPSSPPSSKPPPPPSIPSLVVAVSAEESGTMSADDTDGDSAVSSSRSSFSPSGSPLPERASSSSAEDSNTTSAAATSALRVLKAQSVEALNRKNVLQSARFSSGGVGSAVPSPHLLTTVEAGSRIERSSPRLRLSSSERLEVKTAFITDVVEPTNRSSLNPPRRPSAASKDVKSFRALAEQWEAIATTEVAAAAVVPSPPTVAPPPPPPTTEPPSLNQPELVLPSPSPLSSSLPSARQRSKSGSGAVVVEMRKAFERVKEELMEETSSESKPHGIFSMSSSSSTLSSYHHPYMNHYHPHHPHYYHHTRMSSLDSTTSDDMPQPFGFSHGAYGIPFGVRDTYGSISSLASSTSLISPQELQQLLDDANQSLEESGTPSHEIVVVVLHRGDGVGVASTLTPGLGITLAGGADYETKEITIHKVITGSVADRDGRVQKGDRVLSINGKGLKGVTHREALAILKAPRPEVVLVLSRNRSVSPAQSDVSSGRAGDDCHQLFVMAMTATSTAVDNVNHNQLVTNMSSTSNSYSTGMLLRGGVHQPSSVTSFLPISSRPPRILESPSSDFAINYSHSVSHLGNGVAEEAEERGPALTTTLVKDGAGLGFSLEGGKDSPLGDRPLTIKKIFTGGAASKNGTLRVGDQILSVNGRDVTVLSRIEAWNLMKKLPDGAVQLVIRHKLII